MKLSQSLGGYVSVLFFTKHDSDFSLFIILFWLTLINLILMINPLNQTILINH